MKSACFLIDGFNLYHSTREAAYRFQASTKWLDKKGLCESYLANISNTIGDKVTLKKVYYFSALAEHREAFDPDVTKRHKDLIKCLEDTGVDVELNRFKPKDITCPNCKKRFKKYEEKETDVSIALKLIEVFINGECDLVVIMSGDTDLSPAIKTAQRLFPSKRALFAFPFRRKNRELLKLAPGSFKINGKQYIKHQFPNPYQLSNGKEIFKPISW